MTFKYLQSDLEIHCHHLETRPASLSSKDLPEGLLAISRAFFASGPLSALGAPRCFGGPASSKRPLTTKGPLTARRCLVASRPPCYPSGPLAISGALAASGPPCCFRAAKLTASGQLN